MSPSSVCNDGIKGVNTDALLHLGPNVGKPVRRPRYYQEIQRTSAKSFSSARGDRKKKYPSQEDILERAKPALPLEEEFNDLFLEDLVWAHAVSLHQRLDMPQFHFAAPLVALLRRGLQDKEQIKRLTPEAEFMARYAATIRGRNLELAQVCLSKLIQESARRDILEAKIEYLEGEVRRFKEIDPLFAAGSGLEEDPFVIDDEVPQRSPCSSCAKESYVGPVRTGQHCTPHGQRPGSSLSEDSNAPQRRFKIWRRQATPSERLLMGETLYRDFNGSRAARKRRAKAIDFLNEEPLSAPRDVSPRLENLVPIPIPPPITSSSRCEGLSTSGVPLDSIPRDIESHHEFVEEWALRLSTGEALRYGIGWEKVPGKEPHE